MNLVWGYALLRAGFGTGRWEGGRAGAGVALGERPAIRVRGFILNYAVAAAVPDSVQRVSRLVFWDS